MCVAGSSVPHDAGWSAVKISNVFSCVVVPHSTTYPALLIVDSLLAEEVLR